MPPRPTRPGKASGVVLANGAAGRSRDGAGVPFLDRHPDQKLFRFRKGGRLYKMLDNSPSQHDRIQFIWRYEAAWTLLWALGFVAQPVQRCDVEFAVGTMTGTTTSQFIEDSELRPIADILIRSI